MRQTQMDEIGYPWSSTHQEAEQQQEEHLVPYDVLQSLPVNDNDEIQNYLDSSPLGEDDPSALWDDGNGRFNVLGERVNDPYAFFDDGPGRFHVFGERVNDPCAFFDDGPGRFNVLGERVNDQEEADYENGWSPNTARSLGLPADGDYLGENVNAQEAVLTGNENVSSPSFTARSSLPKEDDDISDHSDNSSALASTDVKRRSGKAKKRKRTNRQEGSADCIQLFESTDIFWHYFDKYLVVNGTWTVPRKGEKNPQNVIIRFVNTPYIDAYQQMLSNLRAFPDKVIHIGPRAFCIYSYIDGFKLGDLVKYAFHRFVRNESQPEILYFVKELHNDPRYQKVLGDSAKTPLSFASHLQLPAPWVQSSQHRRL